MDNLLVSEWVTLWLACHSVVDGSPVRVAFPDGRSLERQDALLVMMFREIESRYRALVKEAITNAST